VRKNSGTTSFSSGKRDSHRWCTRRGELKLGRTSANLRTSITTVTQSKYRNFHINQILATFSDSDQSA
jgi:hypothetical protein